MPIRMPRKPGLPDRTSKAFPILVRLRAARVLWAIPILVLAIGRPPRAGEGEAIADPGYTETVSVTSTRLDDRTDPARDVPASITVLTRRQIEASGARTVQELLGSIAGAILYDQIGNGIQTTFDLRGFTGGGITVLVDGARINDLRNNAVHLETIGLESVERIEVTRGAAAATVGGGSAGGVVNIVTRSGGGPPSAIITGSYGTFATAGGALRFSGSIPVPGSVRPYESPVGPPAGSGSRAGSVTGAGVGSGDGTGSAHGGFDWFVSAQRDTSDGFRQNAAARMTRIGASASYTFESGSRLWLALRSADDTIGAPGSLTLQEFNQDPEQSTFNQADNSILDSRQGTLAWRGPLGGSFSLAANLSYLTSDSNALTTGRSAGLYGGFILDAAVRALGGAVQSTALVRTGGVEHTLAFGGEGQGGTSDDNGCGTSPDDLEACDPASFLNSINRTGREDLAVFAQDSLRLGAGVTLLAGVRWDRSRFDYQETLPDPANTQSRTFSQTSWKGGLAWNPSPEVGLYANYGESFQPPTVEDLFAFPGFGSNPALQPVDAKNYEFGLRGRLSGAGVQAGPAAAAAAGTFTPSFDYLVSIFRTNISNEIIFTPRPTPQDPYAGLNENVGRSYREGAELTVGWYPARWVALSGAFAWTRARYVCSSADSPGSARCADGGSSGGNIVPLVPDHRYAVSALLFVPKGVDLRLDLLQVGSQALANDEANSQQRLEPYFVVNARATWRPSPRIELFAEGRNILNESYATRGIYALDFSTFTDSVFVTPAPPRTIVAGATLAF